VTVYATYPHYGDHLAPVAALLPPDLDVALVAGFNDVVAAKRAGHKRIVLMQHGAGQSYGGDKRAKVHPNYPGGRLNDAVGLFLTPNEHSADRWRQAYPLTPAVAVGCPKLDTLPTRSPKRPYPVVALSFHFDLYLYPETRSALDWYRSALPALARTYTVIGTGHPRRNDLASVYAKAGIEYVPDFAEVCRRADVLAFDNTSAGYEFAATGRPVVVMDAPWYRSDARHGLRFWDAANVGVRASVPDDLAPAIERALQNKPTDVADREDALETVYSYRYDAAQRAADAIMEWAG
jgi:hypothetical protein